MIKDKKPKLLFLLSFLLINSVFFLIISIDKDRRIQNELNKQVENLRNQYILTQDYFIRDAKQFEDELKNNTKIIQLFKQSIEANEKEKNILRENLIKILTPFYAKMREKGILQFQFVYKNNISFLRMHKTDKYGDDLSDIRYSFDYVNKNQKSITGFEQGRTAHAIRYVFPIKINNKHIGAVELSLSSNYIQDKLVNINKIHSHFLVNKDIFKTKAWDTKYLVSNYKPSLEHKDYMYSYTNDDHTLDIDKKVVDRLKDKIDENIDNKIAFSLYTSIKNKTSVITFLPIHNTQKSDVVAYLVSYKDSEYINSLLNSFVYLNILFSTSLFLLLYFLYKSFIDKLKMKEKIEKLSFQIENELEKNMQQELKLLSQAKMATMGEMIGNIAHQWRQPLGSIKIIASEIKLYDELGKLDELNLDNQMGYIIKKSDYLSETVDTFRNYLKETKEKKEVIIQERIKDSLGIVELSLKDNHIKLIDNIDYKNFIRINIVPGELMEVIINIITNAKDAIIENSIEDGEIIVDLKQKENRIVLTIEDNAGGIPEDIKDKIFEKYFTTKGDSNGTGLGLHMSYQIITNGLGGELFVENINKGARFYIVIPC